MNECSIQTQRHFSACASLAAIGVKVHQLDLFGPIRKSVRIAQKTVKHTPIDKVSPKTCVFAHFVCFVVLLGA